MCVRVSVGRTEDGVAGPRRSIRGQDNAFVQLARIHPDVVRVVIVHTSARAIVNVDKDGIGLFAHPASDQRVQRRLLGRLTQHIGRDVGLCRESQQALHERCQTRILRPLS